MVKPIVEQVSFSALGIGASQRERNTVCLSQVTAGTPEVVPCARKPGAT